MAKEQLNGAHAELESQVKSKEFEKHDNEIVDILDNLDTLCYTHLKALTTVT